MTDSGASSSSPMQIPDSVLMALVERAETRAERFVTVDEIMGDLAVIAAGDATEQALECAKRALADRGVTVDVSEPDPGALTDEALLGAAIEAGADHPVAVILHDPVVDGDDLVERRHRARFKGAASRDALRLGSQAGAGGSADPVRMYLKEIGRVVAAHRARGGGAGPDHRSRAAPPPIDWPTSRPGRRRPARPPPNGSSSPGSSARARTPRPS